MIFLFNTAGYFIAFKTQQYQVKSEIESEIKAGINTNELTTVTISKMDLSDIQWMESGKEMRYNGEMYDVVKSSETSNSVTYYCINDAKEESLFANLDDHINTHVLSNVPQKSSKKLIDHVVKLYFSTPPAAEFSSTAYSQNFSFGNSIFTSVIIEKNAPPPEFV